MLDQALLEHLGPAGGTVAPPTDVKRCDKCNASDMVLKETQGGKWMVSCTGYPDCKHAVWLNGVTQGRVLPESDAPLCNTCGAHLIELSLPVGMMQPTALSPQGTFVGCLFCSEESRQVFNIRAPRQGGHPAPGAQPIAAAPQGTHDPPHPTTGATSAPHGATSHCHDDDALFMMVNLDDSANSARATRRYSAVAEHPDEGYHAKRQRTTPGISTYQANAAPVDAAVTPDPSIQCFCKQPVDLRTTNAGQNKGRQFYACSEPEHSPNKCGFFAWADAEIGPACHCGTTTFIRTAKSSGTERSRVTDLQVGCFQYSFFSSYFEKVRFSNDSNQIIKIKSKSNNHNQKIKNQQTSTTESKSHFAIDAAVL